LAAFLARMKDPSRKWRPDDHQLSIILANFEISPEGTISPHLSYDRHMQVVRALWEFRTYSRFQKVQCPVLMLPARPPAPWSAEEQGHMGLKERGIARASQTIPDLQVHWMEDAIHDIPLQKPQALANEILAFSRGLPT
jgi:pimeloyl-ACP methyl ester carboxylesterase